MAKTTRTTITIPLTLKAKMDAVENINWSAVSRAAFEVKLAEISDAEPKKSLPEVVARLRAMKRGNKSYDLGFEAGVKWAEDKARPEELEALDELRHQYELESLRNARENEELVASLKKLARADYDSRRSIIIETAKNALAIPNKEVDADYSLGFGDGALDVWDKVKDVI